MRNTGRRDYQHAGLRLTLFGADGKAAASFKHQIDLVRALMRVDALRLIRLKTVQPNTDVHALPERGLVKLLRVDPSAFAPIDEVIHRFPRVRSDVSVESVAGGPSKLPHSRLRRIES